jgi:hypothetical protein
VRRLQAGGSRHVLPLPCHVTLHDMIARSAASSSTMHSHSSQRIFVARAHARRTRPLMQARDIFKLIKSHVLVMRTALASGLCHLCACLAGGAGD